MTRVTSGAVGAAPPSVARHGVMLAMLVIAYTLNFVDRQVIGILAAPIKQELGLSDTELGLMGGVAFALFYSVLGIPLAMVADRTSRAGVIAMSIAVWSAFTALCATASGFWGLFLARVGVGVGEAGGVAPSFALVADAVPPAQRARALSVFAFGSPIGSALGIFLGGYIATRFDWRVTFVVLGAAGLVFAPLFRRMVRDPRPTARPRAASSVPIADAEQEPPGIGEVWRALRGNGSFWLLSLGAASTSLVGYGLLFWLPSFFARSYGLDLITTSWLYGSIVLVGGLVGLWGGGWLADHRATQSRRAYALVPAAALTLAVPCYAAGLLTSSLPLTFVLFLVPNALGLMWYGPVTAAVQGLVPAASRATASAVYLLVLNLLGIGGGALFFGALSDALAGRLGQESLRYAILAGLVFYLVAAGLFFAASRRVERDWHE
ncbi:MAG: MFS transporter [Gemmatimonadaceae bacterium]|nr:MFS transporter [Gemmatimonadaceae bacterium]